MIIIIIIQAVQPSRERFHHDTRTKRGKERLIGMQ